MENIIAGCCYKKWKIIIITSLIFGYATFYVVRLNFSIAIPIITEDYGFNKTQVGLILSLFSIIYGFGKFIFGYLCDHTNPKWFLIVGLLGTGIINLMISFGGVSNFSLLCFLWSLNGCFQAMGWPSCAKILTHLFSQKEIGTIWGICNSSHAIGSACIAVCGSYLLVRFGIHAIFFVPSLSALGMAFLLMWSLGDLPKMQNGLRKNSSFEKKITANLIRQKKDLLKNHILNNSIMWSLCLSNFFLYIVRIGFINWIPSFLIENQGESFIFVGWQLAGFEGMGILGGIIAGYLSDRIGVARRPIIAIRFLFGLFICLVVSYVLQKYQITLLAFGIICAGFFIYGPQVLAGVIATDYISKEMAATATGMIGTAGYVGATLAGVGIGWIVDRSGWGWAYNMLTLSSLFSLLSFYISLKILKTSYPNDNIDR